MTDLTKRLTDRPNVLANIDKIVRDAYANGNLPIDAKLALVNTVDTEGIKITAIASLKSTEKLNIKVKAIFEHDWDGNDTGAIQTVIAIK